MTRIDFPTLLSECRFFYEKQFSARHILAVTTDKFVSL